MPAKNFPLKELLEIFQVSESTKGKMLNPDPNLGRRMTKAWKRCSICIVSWITRSWTTVHATLEK